MFPTRSAATTDPEFKLAPPLNRNLSLHERLSAPPQEGDAIMFIQEGTRQRPAYFQQSGQPQWSGSPPLTLHELTIISAALTFREDRKGDPPRLPPGDKPCTCDDVVRRIDGYTPCLADLSLQALKRRHKTAADMIKSLVDTALNGRRDFGVSLHYDTETTSFEVEHAFIFSMCVLRVWLIARKRWLRQETEKARADRPPCIMALFPDVDFDSTLYDKRRKTWDPKKLPEQSRLPLSIFEMAQGFNASAFIHAALRYMQYSRAVVEKINNKFGQNISAALMCRSFQPMCMIDVCRKLGMHSKHIEYVKWRSQVCMLSQRTIASKANAVPKPLVMAHLWFVSEFPPLYNDRMVQSEFQCLATIFQLGWMQTKDVCKRTFTRYRSHVERHGTVCKWVPPTTGGVRGSYVYEPMKADERARVTAECTRISKASWFHWCCQVSYKLPASLLRNSFFVRGKGSVIYACPPLVALSWHFRKHYPEELPFPVETSTYMLPPPLARLCIKHGKNMFAPGYSFGIKGSDKLIQVDASSGAISSSVEGVAEMATHLKTRRKSDNRVPYLRTLCTFISVCLRHVAPALDVIHTVCRCVNDHDISRGNDTVAGVMQFICVAVWQDMYQRYTKAFNAQLKLGLDLSAADAYCPLAETVYSNAAFQAYVKLGRAACRPVVTFVNYYVPQHHSPLLNGRPENGQGPPKRRRVMAQTVLSPCEVQCAVPYTDEEIATMDFEAAIIPPIDLNFTDHAKDVTEYLSRCAQESEYLPEPYRFKQFLLRKKHFKPFYACMDFDGELLQSTRLQDLVDGLVTRKRELLQECFRYLARFYCWRGTIRRMVLPGTEDKVIMGRWRDLIRLYGDHHLALSFLNLSSMYVDNAFGRIFMSAGFPVLDPGRMPDSVNHRLDDCKAIMGHNGSINMDTANHCIPCAAVRAPVLT